MDQSAHNLAQDEGAWARAVEQSAPVLGRVAEERKWPQRECGSLVDVYRARRRLVTGRLFPHGHLALVEHFGLFASDLWDGHRLAQMVLGGDRDADSLLAEVYSRTLACWLRNQYPAEGAEWARSTATAFWGEKVIERRRRMLSSVSVARRALRPRLVQSLANYVTDLQRAGRALGPQLPVDPEGNEVEPADERTGDGVCVPPTPDEMWDDAGRRLGEQLGAIRAIDMPGGRATAPHRPALLLLQRGAYLLFFWDYLNWKGTGDWGDAVLKLEQVTAWTQQETAAPIGIRSLGAAWQALVARVWNTKASPDGLDYAAAAGVRDNTWLAWLTHGRRRVIERIGRREAGRLFKGIWPAS